MQPADPCLQCQRPRHTDADLERWKSEFAEFKRTSADGELFNPQWARELCWTKRGYSCA